MAQIDKKYPLAYTQRFEILEARIAKAEENEVGAINVSQDLETGKVTLELLDLEDEVIASNDITITGKLLKGGYVDVANNALVLTCLDDSEVSCDISELISQNVPAELGQLRFITGFVEGDEPQAPLDYEGALEILNATND